MAKWKMLEDGRKMADKTFAPNEKIEPAITFKPSSPRIVGRSAAPLLAIPSPFRSSAGVWGEFQILTNR